jgi:type II secretory pathway component PulF
MTAETNAMNYDEFSFFNQQLAAMLRDGIPLEGALKQLSAGMKDEPLRAEIQALENDLTRGTPLPAALAQRQLPELYRRMVEIGARSNDLPGVLLLLADHYQRAGALWNRLKGLMVYPLIVIFVSLGLTVIVSLVFSQFMTQFAEGPFLFERQALPVTPAFAAIWVPPLLLAVAGVLGLIAVLTPAWRARLRWRLPAFREASLAQLASALALMTRNGVTLPDALALAEAIEANSPAGKALRQWRRLVEAGQGKPTQWPDTLQPLPPMFLWLVRKGGENITAGFEKAAEIYRARAAYRIELALYGALPVSILLLGQMVFWQVAPLFRMFVLMMNALGGTGGD